MMEFQKQFLYQTRAFYLGGRILGLADLDKSFKSKIILKTLSSIGEIRKITTNLKRI